MDVLRGLNIVQPIPRRPNYCSSLDVVRLVRIGQFDGESADERIQIQPQTDSGSTRQ